MNKYYTLKTTVEEEIADSLIEQKYVLDDALSEITLLKEMNEEQSKVIQRLVAVSIKSNKDIESIKGDIDDIRNRMLSNNVLIHNLPEVKGEEIDLVGSAKRALKRAGY